MSFWAFTKGAASMMRKEVEREEMAEEERLEWQRRLEFQQKLQEQAEAAKEKRRKVASGYDPGTGSYYEIDAQGNRAEYKAPKGVIDEYAKKQKAEEDDRLRKINNEEADNRRADRQLDISGGYLAQSREQTAYQKERDKENDRIRNLEMVAKGTIPGYGFGGGMFASQPGGGATPTNIQSTMEAVYKRLVSDETVSPEVKAAAAQIYGSSGKPLAQRLEDLRALEQKRFGTAAGTPGSSKDNPIDATTLPGPPPSGTWFRTPSGKVIQQP